jgi:hypothetical protein
VIGQQGKIEAPQGNKAENKADAAAVEAERRAGW